MKKLMILEIAVLAILLAATVIVCVNFPAPVFAPGTLQNAPSTPTSTEPAGTEPSVAPTTAPTEFVPNWNTYPTDRKLLAQQYFVYDCKENKFLVSSAQENTRVYPASITKLFTAYVAKQYLEPDSKITAGNALDLVAWGSSVAKIKKGDVLTVQQLIEAMMLPSGNDASYLLACEVGRIIKQNPQLGASAAANVFVSQMNSQAASLGMTGTHFVNPDGIHDKNHYTTFADLAILGKLAMADATVMQYAVQAKDQVTLHGETIDWKNTNKLIDPASSYYCPYAVGLKTGQTPDAGSCLLSAFRFQGKELLIGVFGCPKEDDRFDDTLQLFNQIVLP